MCLHVKKAVMASGKILTLATVCSPASNIKSVLKKNNKHKHKIWNQAENEAEGGDLELGHTKIQIFDHVTYKYMVIYTYTQCCCVRKCTKVRIQCSPLISRRHVTEKKHEHHTN